MDFGKAAEKILAKSKVKPTVGLILGSGLGYLTEQFEDATSIDYSEIEGFPRSTVEGHRGRFVVGLLNDEAVVAMDGRFHFYEGHEIQDVVKPIYVFKEMGVERLIVTNAAGGINRSFVPGDIVAIKDVINFSFNNPLIGPNKEKYGVRFPDMSSVIDREWLEKVKHITKSVDVDMKLGTYIFVTGPSYETPAEIKAYESFGADMVGMSTVPELIAASHCSIKVLAFSCITNMASGILDKKLNHNEVVETAQKVRSKFSKIVTIALTAFREEKL